MLHLIPAPLHRLALRLAHALRKLWWRAAKPRLMGVNVILLDGEGRVLLVRHSYGSGSWTLPGGGLKRGEPPLAAARRELAEELNCAVEDLSLLGMNERRLHGAPCVSHVYAARLDALPQPDGREVSEARFFPRDGLPAGRAAMVDAALALASIRTSSEQR